MEALADQAREEGTDTLGSKPINLHANHRAADTYYERDFEGSLPNSVHGVLP